MNRTLMISVTAIALGALGNGCGGAAVPVAAQTDATAAVRAAEAVGADGQPAAAYHLELANEQLATAEELIDRGQMERAERVLRRAEADAQLAVALSNVAEVRDEADQTQVRIREMRDRHL